jgi:hypothetical protein
MARENRGVIVTGGGGVGCGDQFPFGSPRAERNDLTDLHCQLPSESLHHSSWRRNDFGIGTVGDTLGAETGP